MVLPSSSRILWSPPSTLVADQARASLSLAQEAGSIVVSGCSCAPNAVDDFRSIPADVPDNDLPSLGMRDARRLGQDLTARIDAAEGKWPAGRAFDGQLAAIPQHEGQ